MEKTVVLFDCVIVLIFRIHRMPRSKKYSLSNIKHSNFCLQAPGAFGVKKLKPSNSKLFYRELLVQLAHGIHVISMLGPSWVSIFTH